jgi:uncharacterized damage-inducible protein DinB
MSDTWVASEDDPRSAYLDPVGEQETVVGYLRSYRLTIEMKCTGLDADQLARRSVPPSTMSLLGMIRHLAQVEQHWFRRVLEGQSDIDRHFWSADDRDLDFDGAVADNAVVAEAWEAWRLEVAHADEWLSVERDLGELATMPSGDRVSVRDVLVHMVEEYARHAGHVDLLRECIDGRTGQ